MPYGEVNTVLSEWTLDISLDPLRWLGSPPGYPPPSSGVSDDGDFVSDGTRTFWRWSAFEGRGNRNSIHAPWYHLSRNGTDRNNSLIKSLRQKRQVITYTLKQVPVPPDVIRWERYYDDNIEAWKYRPRQFYLRLEASKSKFQLSGEDRKRFVTNDLDFRNSYFTDFGHKEDLVMHRVVETGLDDPYPPTYTDLAILRGDVMSTWLSNSSDAMGYRQTDGSGAVSNDPFSEVASPYDYRIDADDNLMDTYSSEIADQFAVAKVRLLTRVRNQKIDLATALAEISQTIGMISKAAVSLGQSFLLFKKGNVAGALTNLLPKDKKEVSNLFLAYRYGLSPLMGDIDGAAQHLAELVLKIVPSKANGKKKETYESVVVDGINTITTTTQITCKYTAIYSLNDELLNQASRLGFTNPANVIWELVPFSFVVDWFYPIGNYLNLLTASEGIVCKEVFKTVTIKETVTCEAVVPSHSEDDGNWKHVEIPISWQIENVQIKREVIPLSEFSTTPLPRLKNPLSTGHVANAVALVTQMFSK
jgi:hypothetical protein